MELKYPLALYICAGVAALFVIAAFITIRIRRKYKGGKKAFLPEYLKKLSMYKTRVVWYTILKYVLIILIITSILLAGFLMSRPYKTESKELANYNRDILLCMDISTTCDNLNAVLIDKLEDMVRELNGEKFGWTKEQLDEARIPMSIMFCSLPRTKKRSAKALRFFLPRITLSCPGFRVQYTMTMSPPLKELKMVSMASWGVLMQPWEPSSR